MKSKPQTDLQTTAFEGLTGLEDQLEAWNELLDVSRADKLFNGPTWVCAHIRAFTPETDVFGWTLSQDSEPVALFAFRKEPSRGRFTLQRAITAADGTFDSDYCEPLVRTGFETEVATALLGLLASRRGLKAAVLTALPERSAFLEALRTALKCQRLPSREHPVASLALELPSSFDEYLKALKPRMRTKVRGALRNAEELGAELSVCSRPDELGGYLEELFTLHGRRWRSAGEAGSFGDERRRRFYKGMAAGFLERGELRLSRLASVDGVLASQLGIVQGGTYYQLQEGYDPERATQRVGVALRGLATQALIREGVQRYDFLAGDSRHKRDWGGQPEAFLSVGFALPNVMARLDYGLRALIDRLRS